MQTENIYPTPDSPEHHHAPEHQNDYAPPAVISNETFTPPAPSMPDLPPTSSDLTSSPSVPAQSDTPMPVIRVLSVRGVEYGMMTLALWVAAATTGWVILNMLNGSSGFDTVVVPTSALVVCLPVFGFFFIRLKKAELRDSQLRLDPSKRRWSQTTQFLAYIALLVNFIYFVYSLLQKASDNKGPSIGKASINLVVVTVIAGGILVYYWFDEHRQRKG